MTKIVPVLFNLLVSSSVTALQPWSSNIHEMIVHHRAERSASDVSDLPVPHDVMIQSVTESTIRLTWDLAYITNPPGMTSSYAQKANFPQDEADLRQKGVKVKVMIYPQADPNDHTFGGPVVKGSTADSLVEREYVNLQPGKLYTFIIATTNEYDMCEPVVINQDTVPSSPTDLKIETFDELKLKLSFLGQDIPHTISTAGAQVEWQEPETGEADCYDVSILPDEGHMITPSVTIENGDPHANTGAKVRQFIHLMPGREYQIRVACTTCGVGQAGPLLSDYVAQNVTIPPMPPTGLEATSVNHESIEVCWVGPEVGVYDKFKIEWQPTTDGRGTDQIHEIYKGNKTVTVPKVEEYNHANKKYCTEIKSTDINPLVPCEAYEIKVSTLMDGVQSLSTANVGVITKPPAPYGFHVTNYTDNFISLSWNGVGQFDGVDILEGIELCIENQGKCLNEKFKRVSSDANHPEVYITNYIDSIKLETLAPGEKHDISLATFCTPNPAHLENMSEVVENTIANSGGRDHDGTFNVVSVKQRVTQYTRPKPPRMCDGKCHGSSGTVDHEWRKPGSEGSIYKTSSLSEHLFDIMIATQSGDSLQDDFMSGIGDHYNYGYDIRIAQKIGIELGWKAPEHGYYEGFVITYSPFSDPSAGLSTNGSIVVNVNDNTHLENGGKNVPPFWQLGTDTNATIYVPLWNQRYTIYIRTVVAGIESEPLIKNIDCGAPSKQDRSSQCKPIQESGKVNLNAWAKNEVEVPLPHMHIQYVSNALSGTRYDVHEYDEHLNTNGVYFLMRNIGGDDIVNAQGTTQDLVFRNTNSFCQSNPCENAQVFVQVCTLGYGCYPKVVFSMCPQTCSVETSGIKFLSYAEEMEPLDTTRNANVPDPTTVLGDKCCGSKSYNSDKQICCHDNLVEATTGHFNNCCGNQIYNKHTTKCCLQGTYHSSPEWTVQLPGQICIAI
jgi:hypothetical protein